MGDKELSRLEFIRILLKERKSVEDVLLIDTKVLIITMLIMFVLTIINVVILCLKFNA